MVDIVTGDAYFGGGVSIHATDFIESGISWSGSTGWREEYGRSVVLAPEMVDLHVIVAGWHVSDLHASEAELNHFDVVGVNLALLGASAYETPVAQRFRFGFNAHTPLGTFGVRVNIAEVFDFLVGLVGLDVMNDDGSVVDVVCGLPCNSRPLPVSEPE